MRLERNVAFSKRHDYVYLIGFIALTPLNLICVTTPGEFVITLEHSELPYHRTLTLHEIKVLEINGT